MLKYEGVSEFFPNKLRGAWERSSIDLKQVQEIRLRVNQSVRVLMEDEIKMPFVYGEREMEEVFRYLCNDSIYAYEAERTQGYLTLSGGHRVGITGELTAVEGEEYIAKYIRYINIRVAHEHKKTGETVIGYLYDRAIKRPLNTLIVSPPGVGKTSLLRDIVRLFSSGNSFATGCNVGVIDERGEIAGAYKGSASLDCGERTDIITGGDKHKGISVLVRAFSPKVIAIDEIGNSHDAEAIFYAGVSGCNVIATVHGNDIGDIEKKNEISNLLKEKLFDRIIVLSKQDGRERYAQIFDGEAREICEKKLLQGYLL